MIECFRVPNPKRWQAARTPGYWIARLSLGTCLLLVLLPCGGCKSSPLRSSSGQIVELNLMTVPVALDLDGRPGPDGISVKLYASAKENPKPVRLREGALELLLFDGAFRRQAAPPPVLRQFKFSADELRANEFTARIGTGYQFFLRWGTNVPTQRIMSVAARYTPPEGQVVLSRPNSITVLAQ
jgi:hypothetical protein